MLGVAAANPLGSAIGVFCFRHCEGLLQDGLCAVGQRVFSGDVYVNKQAPRCAACESLALIRLCRIRGENIVAEIVTLVQSPTNTAEAVANPELLSDSAYKPTPEVTPTAPAA